MSYAPDVTKAVTRYRVAKIGLGGGDDACASQDYEVKEGELSSHRALLDWVATRPPSRILDLGCAGGQVAAELRKRGHHVVGVDVAETEGVRERVDEFVLADLEHGIGNAVSGQFDVIIAADVLEHARDPERVLADARALLPPAGTIVRGVPNFGARYPLLR